MVATLKQFNYKDLGAILIILFTISIIWLVFFSPKDQVTDPVAILESAPFLVGAFLSSPMFFFLILGVLIYLVGSPLMLVLSKPILNKCEYCTSLRGDEEPYLVNGHCVNCNLLICSECFSHTKRKTGCPNCGAQKYKFRKRLGYFRLRKNECGFCTPIRSVTSPLISNVQCRGCRRIMCHKCFRYEKNDKKYGCPKCGSIEFTSGVTVAYTRLPRLKRRIHKTRKRVTKKLVPLQSQITKKNNPSTEMVEKEAYPFKK